MRNLRSDDLFELKNYKLAATVELEVGSQLRSLQHSTNHVIYQMSMYILSGARGVISRSPNATSQPGSQNDTKNDIRPHIVPNQPYKTIETTVYL
jgi:hypothetical protein